MRETTSLGAAISAGFAVDVWKEFEELKEINRKDRTTFHPMVPEKTRVKMYQHWERAVQMSRGWIDSDDDVETYQLMKADMRIPVRTAII